MTSPWSVLLGCVNGSIVCRTGEGVCVTHEERISRAERLRSHSRGWDEMTASPPQLPWSAETLLVSDS